MLMFLLIIMANRPAQLLLDPAKLTRPTTRIQIRPKILGMDLEILGPGRIRVNPCDPNSYPGWAQMQQILVVSN